MNSKINSFNEEFISLKNSIKNINSKKKINDKDKDEIISFKNSYNDLENISLDNNINIDIEAYKASLNKNHKKMIKNKSEKKYFD